MSYFRSYFQKNNTIIRNSQVNTAKNPTTEIFYGSGFSKFIFKIDLTELKSRIDGGEYVITPETKHTLNLTNTIFGDETFLGAKRGTGRQRTNSFDLVLFKINEFWDEGIGFDYEKVEFDYSLGSITYDRRPSNWFNRTTLNQWSVPGIYATNPEIIATIHFDRGNENIGVDITNYVNEILGGAVNHGVGLAFTDPYQDISSEEDQSVAFFTKYTQTFFEPFVESFFDDRIIDNRYNFIETAEQNLYLYVNKGTNFYDLDTLPTVTIQDHQGEDIPTLVDLDVVKVRKGVYRVRFGISGGICDGRQFFYDVWSGLSIDGNELPDVKQKFHPKPHSTMYSIGENRLDDKRFAIQYFGIKQNEKIVRGEKRKVSVMLRSIDDSWSTLHDQLYYRMFITEGRTNVIVHDWTPLDMTNENSFVFDTSFYIPREYFLEIKSKIYSEEIFYDDYIKFEIVSEK